MTIPLFVKATCTLETGKAHPLQEGYTSEQYVLDSLAFNLGSKLITELPVNVKISEEVLLNGQPKSYDYSTEVYVFTKAQLDEFVDEVRKAVNYDIRYMNILKNYQGPVV